MNHLLIIIVSLTIALFLIKRLLILRKIYLPNKGISIYKWMKIDRGNRFKIDQKEKIRIMKKKNRLINDIRKEYKSLKKDEK